MAQVADVPVLLGFMEQDGLLYSTFFLKDPSAAESFAANWTSCGPTTLLGLDAAGQTAVDRRAMDWIAEQYGVLGKDGSLVLNGTEMTDILTDAVFAESSFRLSQLLVKHKRPVYR
jgi:hypothetical protein